jgi:hypothetical protein
MSLFEKAAPKARRLKMYIYGETGTGKTITSLHFPNLAVIDSEKGSDFYGKLFDFDRIQTSDPSEVEKAIDELLKDPGEYKTFVIDPFTAVWETMQEMRLKRMRLKSNNPNYALQPLDWGFLKNNLKGLIKKLLALDMNIICTARAKAAYSPDEFMKVTGLIPDGPKELPFLFDVVLELSVGDDKKRYAKVIKDRTNTLPDKFEFTYEEFVKYVGNEELEREPVIINQQTAMDSYTTRKHEISFKGKTIKTAGVTAEQLDELAVVADSDQKESLAEKLRVDYMVTSLLDLKEDEAAVLLKDLK